MCEIKEFYNITNSFNTQPKHNISAVFKDPCDNDNNQLYLSHWAI